MDPAILVEKTFKIVISTLIQAEQLEAAKIIDKLSISVMKDIRDN